MLPRSIEGDFHSLAGQNAVGKPSLAELLHPQQEIIIVQRPGWHEIAGAADPIFVTPGGLVIGAVYMLRAIRNLLHGPLVESCAGLADAPHAWRKLPFVLLVTGLLVFGFFPALLTDKIKPSAEVIVRLAGGATGVPSQPKPGSLVVQSEASLPAR